MHFLKVAKNTFFQTLAKFSSSFIGFLITIIIASSFGVLGYGDFIKITSFVAPFYLIVDFGLNAFYLQLKEKEENYLSLFWLRIYLALITVLIINLINLFLPYDQLQNIGYSPQVKLGILIFSLSLFSQAIIFSSMAIFQQRLKYFYYMLAIIFGSLINLVLVLIFSFKTESIIYIIIAFVVSGFVTALFAQGFVKEKITGLGLNWKIAKGLLRISFPLALMLIFNLIYFRVDAILLAILKSTTDVGVYGLAYKFFEFLIALPLFLSNSIYPLLLQNQKNLRRLKAMIRNYSFIFILSSVLLIFPCWFLSPFFVLISKDFAQAVLPFKILLLSLPFFFISSFFQWVLISFKRQTYLLLVYFLTALLNIVLNLIFIPSYSYLAAATITIVSEALVALLLLIKLLTERNIRKEVTR